MNESATMIRLKEEKKYADELQLSDLENSEQREIKGRIHETSLLQLLKDYR